MKDYFTTITLTGGTVRVEGWSFDTYQANIATLFTLIAEALSQTDGDTPLLELFTPLIAKSRPLIVASLEHGEDDLAKARGLKDILTLTEAVIAVNGIDEVFVGKLTGAINNLTKMLTPSPQATSPKPSSAKPGKAGKAS